jgi:hypothetical protein
MVAESQTASNFRKWLPPANALHEVYDTERQQADLLPHRKYGLEALAFRLQFTKQRDAVQQIIDGHRRSLPVASEQTEEDKLWRLALHRMDLRCHTANIVEAPAGDGSPSGPARSDGKGGSTDHTKAIMLEPRPVDEDVQEIIDREAPAQVVYQQAMALLLWGMAVWRGENENSSKPTEWQARLSEARGREGRGEEAQEYLRDGPVFVAAVCVRDHWAEMSSEDRDWCLDLLIAAIKRDCDSDDIMVRSSRSGFDVSGPAAFILPRVYRESLAEDKSTQLSETIGKALTHARTYTALSAAEGIGYYLASSHRDFAIRCVSALAEQGRLLQEIVKAEKAIPYGDRQGPEQLEKRITPNVRLIIAGNVDAPDAERVISQLDLREWPAQTVLDPILTILRHCPDDPLAVKAYKLATDTVVAWWNADRDDRGVRGRSRNFQLEYEWLEKVARFVLRLPPAAGAAVCEPLTGAVGEHPREIVQFVRSLVSAEDQSDGVTSFWPLWQIFANRIQETDWIGDLDSRYSHGEDLLNAMFLGLDWKKGVRHWRRLDGHADQIDRLFKGLPPCAKALDAYCRFLYTIGNKSLPNAFIVIAERLEAGNAREMLSIGNTVYCLESLLRQSVYSIPQQLKANGQMRSAILRLLDELVESSSSAAYRMRDDFVTPLSA